MRAHDMTTHTKVLQQLLQATQEGFWFIDNETVTLDVNPAMCRILGRSREEIVGRPIFDFVDETNAEIFHQEIAARCRGRQGSYEIALCRPDGSNVPCVNNATPVLDDKGQKIGSIGLWTDISEIKRTEEALRKARNELDQRVRERTAELAETNEALRFSEERMRSLIEYLPLVIFLKDLEGRFQLVNPRFEEWYGSPVGEIVGRTAHDILPKHLADVLTSWDREVLESDRAIEREIRLPFKDGSYHRIVVTKYPVRDANDKTAGVGTITSDVTQQRETEERLRQAQKMEAVGQLTGGVAHDFNNLLSVIVGNAELLEGRLGQEDEQLGAILRAATRGSELTQRLLAFSRRQPLSPQALNVGELLGGMSHLLRRTLGATIDVETHTAPGLWAAAADPGQVENALLNLALNARDAMANGGKLTIECSNVQLDRTYAARNPEIEPGNYVTLAVSDEGCGMSAEERNRAFEPFFTTKEVGQGSGLGLSMVYGFAKQSGGHVSIYSELGRGTTVKLYLPRATKATVSAEVSRDDDIPRGRGEEVLVLEDDQDVRGLVVAMLEDLGYRVSAVADAAAAHEFLSKARLVDLVLSDVVLPGGTSGPDFADQARAAYPELKILFMSGYPAMAANRNGFLGSDKVLLNKPFQRRELAKALRAKLDR